MKKGMSMTKSSTGVLLAVCSAAALVATPLHAAKPKVSEAAVPPLATNAPEARAPQWTLKGTYGQWGVLCNPSSPSECRAAQTQKSVDEKNPGTLLQVLFAAEKGKMFGVFTLPFGVDLRAGIAVRIDEGEEVKGSFMTCMPDGCQSITEINETLLAQIRKGKVLKVGFRSWGGGDKTLVVDVPLEGAGQAIAASNP
jgi:invasion protein IalB